jgi:hypothetical protein
LRLFQNFSFGTATLKTVVLQAVGRKTTRACEKTNRVLEQAHSKTEVFE